MPILERDPWRLQFFTEASCPEEVIIPTDDPDCWTLYPQHRWVYDKLRIAHSQGLDAAPHGVMPARYPVFSKPIVNLKGMGVGSVAIHSEAEMRQHHNPGHMWMPLFDGVHVSSDCAVANGQVHWIRHATGVASSGGMFDFWRIEAAANPIIERLIVGWVKTHMPGYCGMMNFETISGKIIEVHLRFSDQWPDLYGAGWVDALVRLYADKRWEFDDKDRQDGFSIPLFAHHGFEFEHPSAQDQAALREMRNISSLQITFHKTLEAASHAMPTGGFRLAVINATDLASGLAARERLRQSFPANKLFDDP